MEAVSIIGYWVALIATLAGTGVVSYQFGRMSAFAETLRHFDRTIGSRGCGCTCAHEREHRDRMQKGAMHG